MRRVVGGDAIDAAVVQTFPHGLAIILVAQRGIYFAVRIVVAHFFIREEQMVRRYFAGNVYAIFSSLAEMLQCRCGRDVGNVKMGLRFSRKFYVAGDN